MLGEKARELRHVGFAGGRIGSAQVQELEEVLRSAGGERGRGGHQQVDLAVVAGPQLDSDPATVTLGVVRLGIAARVREPHQRRDRLALEVEGAREGRRVERGGEGARAPGALRVQGAAPAVRAVDAVGGVDDPLVEIPLGHRHRP
jgi:hypothetical protein